MTLMSADKAAPPSLFRLEETETVSKHVIVRHNNTKKFLLVDIKTRKPDMVSILH